MTVTTIFSQSQKTVREARIDDHPAVLEEPQDHSVTGGRDVSLYFEGGHSPEHHSGIREPRPDFTEAEHVVVNYLPMDRGHLPRTINHEWRND